MPNDRHSPDAEKQSSGVAIGDVAGGIRDSIIASRDIACIHPGERRLP